MLTFISSLYQADPNAIQRDYASLASPLMWFAWGVALSGFAIALAYFTNYSIVAATMHKTYSNEAPYVLDNPVTVRWLRGAYTFQIAAIVTGLSSLGCFVLGMLRVKNAITTFL